MNSFTMKFNDTPTTSKNEHQKSRKRLNSYLTSLSESSSDEDELFVPIVKKSKVDQPEDEINYIMNMSMSSSSSSSSDSSTSDSDSSDDDFEEVFIPVKTQCVSIDVPVETKILKDSSIQETMKPSPNNNLSKPSPNNNLSKPSPNNNLSMPMLDDFDMIEPTPFSCKSLNKKLIAEARKEPVPTNERRDPRTSQYFGTTKNMDIKNASKLEKKVVDSKKSTSKTERCDKIVKPLKSSANKIDEKKRNPIVKKAEGRKEPTEKKTEGRKAPAPSELLALSKVESHKFEANSSKSLDNMKKMVIKENSGLGKKAEGRKDLSSLTNDALKWHPSKDVIEIPEIFQRFKNNEENPISQSLLSSWLKRDSRKLIVEGETKFCDAAIVKGVLESKNVFDKISPLEMSIARTKSNPFESIQSNIFMNRAAVKMANMDSMFNNMFTNPVDQNDVSLINENELLYFADVCAGPGGFSEYVMWKKSWLAKGFGFTLKAENDFKMQDFLAGHPETFHPYYGAKNDGNVCDPANIESLTKLVMDETETGVHIMMADGDFSVENKGNIQEILSKQLYLAQCVVALSIIRTNGHFVVKLFDVLTPFSVGLIYLMSKCFEEITICKPNSSRPENSERYLVCKWKKPDTEDIRRHLFEVNQEMWNNKNSNKDITELVSLKVMQQDQSFFKYITDSNNALGKRQIEGLLKIAAFCKNKQLKEGRQSEIRKKCFAMWNLPDQIKLNVSKLKITNVQYCIDLMTQKWHTENFLAAPEKRLDDPKKLNHFIASVHDYFFVGVDAVEEDNNRTWFMSKGKNETVKYNAKKSIWEPVTNMLLTMSPKTLVYGEIVKEWIKEGKAQTSVNTLHIIDAITLGGINIGQLPLNERNQLCQNFVRSHQKPSACFRAKYTPIRCKRLFKLTESEFFFEALSPRMMKDRCQKMGYDIENPDRVERFYVPRGWLLMNEVRSDKMRVFSGSQNRFYFYDKVSRTAKFPEQMTDAEMFASTKNSFTARLLWKWDCKEQIVEFIENNRKERNLLYRTDVEGFIKSQLRGTRR